MCFNPLNITRAVGLLLLYFLFNQQSFTQEKKSIFVDVNVFRSIPYHEIGFENIYHNHGEFFNGIGVGYQVSNKTAIKFNYYKSRIRYRTMYFGYGNREFNESEISIGFEYRKIPKKRLHFALRADLIGRFSRTTGIYYPDVPQPATEYNHKSNYIGIGLGLNLNYSITKRFTLFASSRYTYGYYDLIELGLKDEDNYILPGYNKWYGYLEILNSFGVRYFFYIPKAS